ncbi:MAG: PTS sugar transporter subunit IIA [Bdellovibrionota bacterium]
MSIAQQLHKNTVFPDLTQDTKDAVIQFMAEQAQHESAELSEVQDLFSRIMQHEAQSSTAIGNGIALPNVKIEGLAEQKLFLGRSRLGIDFGAVDNKPVHLIFLLVSPSQEPEKHCKSMAGISKLLHNSQFRDQLMKAKDQEEIISLVQKFS